MTDSVSAARAEHAVSTARLEPYLDSIALGDGPLRLSPIGEGHSNLTFLLQRNDLTVVLRRPPIGPLAPSANDIVREARLLQALRVAGLRVPKVIAICEQDEPIGAPFYLMEHIAGHVLVDRIPPEMEGAQTPPRIAAELIDTLVELHALNVEQAGLSSFGRPSGYLERQLRRFGALLELNATRPLPDLAKVSEWLAMHVPTQSELTIVHGDYRLGNMMFSSDAQLTAVLDWEMATLGDPLADLGYCTAMWAEPEDAENPMLDLSAVTRLPGFPTRKALAERYVEATGRSLEDLRWYQILALWKAAIFLEGSYGRYLNGASQDTYFARLGDGVPTLAQAALEMCRAS